MLWDLDRSSHQRNYFPNCTYGTGNFERCGCLSRHFTWLGVMRIPSVVAAWIRHVRACAPAGHVTVDIGLLKNAKFRGGFKKWMPFSHLSQILYELEKKSSLVTRALSAKSCARDTDSLHSCTRLRLVQEMACLYHSCKILPRKHSYPNLIPIGEDNCRHAIPICRHLKTFIPPDTHHCLLGVRRAKHEMRNMPDSSMHDS